MTGRCNNVINLFSLSLQIEVADEYSMQVAEDKMYSAAVYIDIGRSRYVPRSTMLD